MHRLFVFKRSQFNSKLKKKIEKSLTNLLPDLWFLSYNKKVLKLNEICIVESKMET